ncbi:hypothetical protein ABZ318_24825 [Streptomyces sp. NPDC006197]|uniref:hypothetical protein n=1 Tax=Streptomyces sp. NPDC006197 TaxID=3156685 RepID=UPI0033BE7785
MVAAPVNTVASLVTVHTDAGAGFDGPLEEGPILHQWANPLGPGIRRRVPGGPTTRPRRSPRPEPRTSYATRALYGCLRRRQGDEEDDRSFREAG